MSEPIWTLEPVQGGKSRRDGRIWTSRLLLFLRVMAGLSLIKGLYHWSLICGFAASPGEGFDTHPLAWQTATVFFAVIDLVAAVGLWLAAAWGAVVWLTASVSMAAVEVFFPQIFGGSMVIVVVEGVLLLCYLFLAIQSAREHPG